MLQVTVVIMQVANDARVQLDGARLTTGCAAAVWDDCQVA